MRRIWLELGRHSYTQIWQENFSEKDGDDIKMARRLMQLIEEIAQSWTFAIAMLNLWFLLPKWQYNIMFKMCNPQVPLVLKCLRSECKIPIKKDHVNHRNV